MDLEHRNRPTISDCGWPSAQLRRLRTLTPAAFLAVLVRGAALRFDEPPKVKQRLGLLSSLCTLSFDVCLV